MAQFRSFRLRCRECGGFSQKLQLLHQGANDPLVTGELRGR